MWKFKLRSESKVNIGKYKERLLARGDQQQHVWNCIFASIVRYTSLQVIVALACYND
jgi:hypothetical protein